MFYFYLILLGLNMLAQASPIDIIPHLASPLTHEGYSHFFNYFNDPIFTERYLPRCLLPVSDVLSHAKDQEEPQEFMITVMSLFHQRIKACRWINPYACAQLFHELITICNPLINEKLGKHRAQPFSDFLTATLDEARFNQEITTTELSTFIMHELQERQTMQEFQTMSVRFIENVLDKLIWDPHDELFAWKVCKAIGTLIEELYNLGYLPDLASLNEILWSLTYRFCYFIELNGSALPVAIYEEMERDLNNTSWLSYEEFEQSMTTKKDTLLREITIGKAKSMAHQHHNIITDAVQH